MFIALLNRPTAEPTEPNDEFPQRLLRELAPPLHERPVVGFGGILRPGWRCRRVPGCGCCGAAKGGESFQIRRDDGADLDVLQIHSMSGMLSGISMDDDAPTTSACGSPSARTLPHAVP